MAPAASSLDFGYPWWLSYGHLVVFAVALAGWLAARRWKWSRWLTYPLAALTLWAGAAAVVARFVIDINGRGTLPTQSFLAGGEGRVVDLGAGTGRSSIMVLEARPKATLVALDEFGHSYEVHFGPGDPRHRLLANLAAAGVAERASIETGDMRELPFEAASFDAAVSAYAMDHLGRDGAVRALGETSRVVKPGGDFLLMVVGNDPWAMFAFGPALMHGTRGLEWWRDRVDEAGFDVVEAGTRPITIYVLGRRR